MSAVLEEQREQAVRVLLESPYRFAHAVGFTKLTPLHDLWIKQMVLGKGDMTLQSHRGSYKTTCVSIALAIIIILFPNDRTAFYRKTDTAVMEIISQVKKILEHEVTQELVWRIWRENLIFTKSNSKELTTNLTNDPRGTAQLTGSGTKSAITGKHFDRIFTDDIVTLEDRYSRAERELTKIFYQELKNVLNRGGRTVNTGTPWHPDDAFTLMPEAAKYDCYTTGLMSAEEIRETKESMTASLFAANYELKHIAAEDVIFDSPETGEDPQKATQGYAHVDAAYYGEDYTALTILNFHDGKWYVFGKCWRRHVIECKASIEQYYREFQCGVIYNELNADKGMLAKELRKDGLRVSTYNENMNKHYKITSYLKFDWKNVIFVAGTDAEYIDQICDYNENAEHDDCPDSLSSLMRALWKKKNKKTEQADTSGLLFL